MADSFSLDSKPVRLCDVPGFRTGASACGLKPEGPDVGVLYCQSEGGVGTALLTDNAVRAAPVRVSSPRSAMRQLRAAIVNAGNANCCTGEQGMKDAGEMLSIAGGVLGVPGERLLVASSGRAGIPLPMEKVRRGVEEACKSAREAGSGDFAGAMGPCGVAPYVASATGTLDGRPFHIAGVARGSCAAEADMAMVLAFLVTDALVAADCLREILVSTAEQTFKRLIVDRGQGANDTLCVLASGAAGNEVLDNVFSAGVFAEALSRVAAELAAGRVAEGDGGARHIEVRVSGAASEGEAEAVSRAVAESVLVNAALQRGDPNWGLILAAAGRTAAKVDESRATVRLAGQAVYEQGRPVPSVPEELRRKLGAPGLVVEVGLGVGGRSAVSWAEPLPGPDVRALDAARRAADEAAARAGEVAGRLAALEGERASLEGKLEQEACARRAAAGEIEALRKRLDEANGAREAAARSAESALRDATDAGVARQKELTAKLREAEAAATRAAEQSKGLAARLEKAESDLAEAGRGAEASRLELESRLREAEGRAEERARSLDERHAKKLAEATRAYSSAAEERKTVEDGLRRELEEAVARAASAGEAARRSAESALEDARGEAEARQRDLEARLKAAEAALEEAKRSTAAEREGIEAKLREAEAGREAASRESESLRGRLEAAGKNLADAERAAEEAKAGGRQAAKAERKELLAKLKEAEAARDAAEKRAGEAEGLRADLGRREEEVARTSSLLKEAEEEARGLAERLKAAEEETTKVKLQFGLKDQLIKQLLAEDEEHKRLKQEHHTLVLKIEELEKKAQ